MNEGEENLDIVGGDNAWIELGFSEADAEELEVRSCLLDELQKAVRYLQRNGVPQKDMVLSTDEAKLSKITAGKLSEFSTSHLITYLSKLGLKPKLKGQE